MNHLENFVGNLELHSVEGIQEGFAHGIDPNSSYEGKTLFQILVSMYTRSPRFGDCVRVFVDNGLAYENKAVLAVLLDDAPMLEKLIEEDPGVVKETVSLDCAYTPLSDVSLLHVCAEFNHVACAKMLVKHGADVNARAGMDDYGFGGQSPVFHTVNQNNNRSADMLDYLLSQSVDLAYTVKGLIWGRGYPWETFIPAVNPISYAMMGLLPQVHRDEVTISAVVSKLIKHAYGIDYIPVNVPNEYLRG